MNISDMRLIDIELFRAVRSGNLEKTKDLLAAGADPNAKDKDDWTPLHLASNNDFPELAKILLKAGADPNAKTYNGLTPLHFALYRSHHLSELVNILLEFF